MAGAAADAGVLLCDVRTAFGSLSADELETMLLPAPDLLHLSPVGHAFYADVCQPAVESALDGAIAHATA